MSSVPFFKNFQKRTRGFFREEKENRECYDLKQRVQFGVCSSDLKYHASVKLNNANQKSKLQLNLKRDFGELKFTEVPGEHKTKLEIKVPNFYRNIGWKSKHSRASADVELEYNPGTYYNATLKGTYDRKSNNNNNMDDNKEDGGGGGGGGSGNHQRVCTSTVSFACGDDSLKLNVGGEITFCDSRPNNDGTGLIQDYRLGFLYEPSEDSSFSVIYSPDKISNGLDFDLSCFKQMSENLSLVARVTGKVDIQKSGIDPILSVGSGYSFGSCSGSGNGNGGNSGKAKQNHLQGFVSSNKEYGIAYQTFISDSAKLSVGLANYYDEQNRSLNSRFGYKLQLN